MFPDEYASALQHRFGKFERGLCSEKAGSIAPLRASRCIDTNQVAKYLVALALCVVCLGNVQQPKPGLDRLRNGIRISRNDLLENLFRGL